MFLLRSRNVVLLVLSSTALSLISVASAFAPQVSFSGRRRQHALFSKSTVARPHTRLQASMEDPGAEVDEMEELILSLSREPTDELRRDRLGAIFTEALSKPNGDPKIFTDLFDQTLIIVGDRVKEQAQQKAIQLQLETAAAQDKVDESSLTPPDKDAATEESSPEAMHDEGIQLWALVDMMVQSKTIIKKESGELGSKGAFG